MGRVWGKFHQVACKLRYEDDSVLSMNVVGRRLTGKDTEALYFDESRAARANAGACQRWSCPQVRRPLLLIGACTLSLCLQIRTLTLSVSGATLMMNSAGSVSSTDEGSRSSPSLAPPHGECGMPADFVRSIDLPPNQSSGHVSVLVIYHTPHWHTFSCTAVESLSPRFPREAWVVTLAFSSNVVHLIL